MTCKVCGKETDMPFHTCDRSNTMNQSPTPRTDAAEGFRAVTGVFYPTGDSESKGMDVPADFARQLERELNEAKKETVMLQCERSVVRQERDQLKQQLEEAKSDLAGISAALDKEFNQAKGDTRGCDLLDDFASFIEHHKEKEQQLLASELARERMKEALDTIFKLTSDLCSDDFKNPEADKNCWAAHNAALKALSTQPPSSALEEVRKDLEKLRSGFLMSNPVRRGEQAIADTIRHALHLLGKDAQ